MLTHSVREWLAMRKVKAATIAVLMTPVGGPVLAQGGFSLPAGCEAYVTVQKADCTVTHLFRCEGDPEGHQRRVDLNESALTYMGVIDSETQWIESFHASSGDTTYLAPDAADPASLTELIETGRDGLDFQTMSGMYGLTRYVGEDRLTGETVVIDGVELLRTAFYMVVYDQFGGVVWEISGNEYIHPEWRTFLSGTRTFSTPDEEVVQDGTPVEFIFPGEPGFLGSTPRHGCGVMMSGLGAEAPWGPVVVERF
jgi:hypothetical protein